MDPSETAAPPSSRRTMNDEHLSHLARDLVLWMMASATREDISPVDWWPRAKEALETACARARTWGELVTTMATKLQIEVLRLDSGKVICSARLDGDDFRAFKRVAKAEAVYVVAEAAAIRQQERHDAGLAKWERDNKEVSP